MKGDGVSPKAAAMAITAGVLALGGVGLGLWMWLHHGDGTAGAAVALGCIFSAAFFKPIP